MVNARDDLTIGLPRGPAPVEWRASGGLVAYAAALAHMDARAAAIAAERRPSRCGCWSIRRSIRPAPAPRPGELLEARFPVFAAGRGGQLTYHGPGQRVAYVMLDLKRRAPDVRRLVATLEEWIIRTLAAFRRRRRAARGPDRRVGAPAGEGRGHEDKIAAIGIRVRHWMTLHGVALNVDRSSSHFSAIVPCGIADPRYGVTSLADLGRPVTMAEVDAALRREFEPLFGPRRSAAELVGSTENSSRRIARLPSSSWRRIRRRVDPRAAGGPRRQASIMAATVSAGPANTASTEPSRRLRTQPSRPCRSAVCSTQARKPTP